MEWVLLLVIEVAVEFLEEELEEVEDAKTVPFLTPGADLKHIGEMFSWFPGTQRFHFEQ